MSDEFVNPDEEIHDLAERVVLALAASEHKIATAESCTGGWIAKALTDIPGSSAVFEYGVVSYSNAAKTSLLKVAKRTVLDHGAVSAATVAAMADGVMSLSGADIAVSVSGIAGPDGGTAQKPVGTVWFGWSQRRGSDLETTTELVQFSGGRDVVRRLSVAHALRGILERLHV